MMENTTFYDKLAQAVRDVGQDLIDHADDIVDRYPLLSAMTIEITFNPEYSMFVPEINVNKNYLCKRALDRLQQIHRMKMEGERHDD